MEKGPDRKKMQRSRGGNECGECGATWLEWKRGVCIVVQREQSIPEGRAEEPPSVQWEGLEPQGQDPIWGKAVGCGIQTS